MIRVENANYVCFLAKKSGEVEARRGAWCASCVRFFASVTSASMENVVISMEPRDSSASVCRALFAINRSLYRRIGDPAI